ncbi:MAG: polysaccharide biosynthesis tyrosine autokinase [Acidobacteria bacterium]|nr:polysaccharide biosynthesis tyrosine autokinase [Acidobacteriota bacterium]
MSDIIKRDSASGPPAEPGRNIDFYRQDPSEDRMEARRFIQRILKRKYQILAFILVVMIPTAIVTHFTPRLYRSSALIQINPDPVQVLPFREIGDLPNAAPYYEVYMKTQEQVLRSYSLSSRVRQRISSEPGMETLQAETPHLRGRFDLVRIENSQLFEISYLAPVPENAASIVNLYAEEYIKELFQSRQETREKARKLLETELEGIESQVQASEKELVQYARDHNITGTAQGQPDLVEQKMAVLAAQLTDIETEIAVAKSKVESVKRARAENFPEQFLTTNISSLNAQILQLENDLGALRTLYGENWPEVVQKRNQIALVREQLKREKASVLARALEQAEMDLLAVERRRQLVAISMSEQQKLVDRYRNASIQYNILRREVETNQNLYEGLLERLRQTSVTAGLEFGNIQVVEPGQPSSIPYSPKILYNLGLAALAGLALGICFAFAMDFWDSSISTLEEAEQLAHFPALGAIPRIKQQKMKVRIGSGSRGKKGAGTELQLKTRSGAKDVPEKNLPPEVAESIRNICASILLSKSDRPPRIIMVTSASPGEGKSTLVGHMGKAFADNGYHTLLVESDMRRPALSEAMGIGKEGGLSLFLSGHISPAPKIHETPTPNLSVISAGPKAPNPISLLNSEKLGSFLNEMASSYQFILLDAPPVLAVADARVLCPRVDGIVLVVRAGRTPKNLIRRAWTLLESSGGNVLGMVINGASRNGSESSYYKYYYQ